MAITIIEVFDPRIYTTITAFYVIIMLTTISINGIVILTFYKVRSILCSPASIPILSLSLADFILAVTAMPFGVAANATRSWYFGHSGCKWYAFTHSVVGLSSILHHAVIAVEKCRTILKPLSTPVNKQGIIKITLAVWGICITWGILPLLGWSSYEREGSGAVCSIKWKSTHPADAWYVIFSFVLFVFVPLIVIVASYAAISHELRKMAKKAKKEWGPNAPFTKHRVVARRKSMQTGLMMFISTFCVWIPYAVLSIMAAVGNPKDISLPAFAIAALIAKTSAFINPIICFFWYTAYREKVKKLFGIRSPSGGDKVNSSCISLFWIYIPLISLSLLK